MKIEDFNKEELKSIRRAFTIYILKVIKHSAINFAKKQKLYESRIVSLSEYDDKEMSLSIIDDGIFYMEEKINYMELENIMTREKYRKAITRLTKREKQIMYLIIIEELDTEEIAKRLNLTTKTVLNTKNNALNKLKNIMED